MRDPKKPRVTFRDEVGVVEWERKRALREAKEAYLDWHQDPESLGGRTYVEWLDQQIDKN